MPRTPSPKPTVNFGPIRLKPEVIQALHQEADESNRSASSVVRELIDLWLKMRKKARKEQ